MMTNYDRIKSMGVEEMAVNLAKIQCDAIAQTVPIKVTEEAKKEQYELCKQWLLQEVSKMTDEQIIKALEYCCGSIQNDCRDCPFGERCENDESLLKYSLDLINRQKEEKEHLEYVLMAVMHSVDKWLEGDELKQDEANRACTMREKTLKITEKLHKKIDGLQRANQESFVAIEKRKGEIERLNTSNNVLRKSNEKMFVTIGKQDAEIERLKRELISADEVIGFREAEIERLQEVTTNTVNSSIRFGLDKEQEIRKAKSEAYKEFAEKFKGLLKEYAPYDTLHIYEIQDRIDIVEDILTEGGNEDGTNHS